MFENIGTFFKRIIKTEPKQLTSKDAAKERLHLVLMQDRANVSADFLELMKQEIIDVIKKYIEIDEKSIDVRLTNQSNEDGTNGAPALYANIPIVNIKNEMKSEINNNKKPKENVNKNDLEKNKNKQEGQDNLKEEKTINKESKLINEKKDNVKKETKENVEKEDEIDDVPTFDELLKKSEEDDDKKNINKKTTNKKTTTKKTTKKTTNKDEKVNELENKQLEKDK